jgi:hypothetical protein
MMREQRFNERACGWIVPYTFGKRTACSYHDGFTPADVRGGASAERVEKSRTGISSIGERAGRLPDRLIGQPTACIDEQRAQRAGLQSGAKRHYQSGERRGIGARERELSLRREIVFGRGLTGASAMTRASPDYEMLALQCAKVQPDGVIGHTKRCREGVDGGVALSHGLEDLQPGAGRCRERLCHAGIIMGCTICQQYT